MLGRRTAREYEKETAEKDAERTSAGSADAEDANGDQDADKDEGAYMRTLPRATSLVADEGAAASGALSLPHYNDASFVGQVSTISCGTLVQLLGFSPRAAS